MGSVLKAADIVDEVEVVVVKPLKPNTIVED